MNSVIHPSIAIIIRADCSISECVQMMRNHQVGSILIVNDTAQADLVGIFTERDLLDKIDLIETGKHWNLPVRTIMTHPVLTLDLSELHYASKFMLEKKIRHLPITTLDSSRQKQRIAGMISMRDLFKIMVKNLAKPGNDLSPFSARTHEIKKTGYFSKDEFFPAFLNRIIGDFFPRELKEIDLIHENTVDCTSVIIDIDYLDAALWTKILIAKNHDPNIESAIILFNPMLHSSEALTALEKLGNSKKFSVLKKPINILKLFECIDSSNSAQKSQHSGRQ